MSKKLSVTAIENGCVIDHIPAGHAVKILSVLALADIGKQLTVGLNLPSKRSGMKDLIKIQDYTLSDTELAQMAVFAPNAHLNIIENTEVIEKKPLTVPKAIRGILRCKNPNCITHAERVQSHFRVTAITQKDTELQCVYCEKFLP